ncbi:hypothetical protein ONZ43_g1376 [Nemania bipapillata]|uniref:Uncharacterized protein n=1 Tax=Nemania bipapillata TaxID=110536 RepID=A0ACC2J4K3_9PEZI|nr:hypothetical protein ONZ43_g1376 [Nemania bipapillata]
MASKRTAEDETEPKAPRNKRHKTTRTDPTSGQRGAFGDLGGVTTAPTGDSDLDCEDDSEALAYLRSVRTQASSIPHVLAAKKAGPSLPPPQGPEGNSEARGECEEQDADRSIYEDGVGDFRGYYQDGAYVAYPEGDWGKAEEDEDKYDEEAGEGEQDEAEYENDNEPDMSDSAEDRPHNSSADEIRDAYFASITNRYIALRQLLQTDPPDSTVAALPATHPTEVGEWKRGLDTFQKWEGRLRGTDPLPAQIAAMHKDSIFRLLRILLTSKFIRKRTELRERTSRWIWALLARLPDKGELDYMEIGWVRELGKRAVLLMVTLAELEVLREHYGVAGSSPDDEDEYEVDADVDDYFEDNLSQDSLDVADAPTPEATEERAEHISSLKTSATNPIADIETAKAQLLAQLNDDVVDGGQVVNRDSSTPTIPVTQEKAVQPTPLQEEGEYGADEDDQDANHERYQELDRAKVNERATLNMILTVAGEFYGQRDLLEFRDPFGGLQFE